MTIRPNSHRPPILVCALILLCLAHGAAGQGHEAVPVHATPPFLLTDDAIRPSTVGFDIEKQLASLSKQKVSSKTEFETNAEFNDRLQKSASKALPAPISTSGNFAVIQLVSSFPKLWLGGNATSETSYSPEAEVMSVKLNSWLGCLPLRRTTTSKRKYAAKNGFGQQITVLEADVSETCIEIAESSQTRITDIAFSFDVPRSDAAKLKPRLAFVVIGKVVPPFVKTETSHAEPTMKEPLELHTYKRSLVMAIADVWLVDTGTGTVLAKHATPFSNSQPSLIGGFRSINGCRYPSYGKSQVPNFDLVVEMAVKVKADGSINEASVARSTGVSDLDARAIQAVSRCKFKPATKEGQPVDGVATVKFHFDASHAGGY